MNRLTRSACASESSPSRSGSCIDALDEDDLADTHAVAVVAAQGVTLVTDNSLRRASDRRLELMSKMVPDPVYQIAVALLGSTGTDASRLRYAQDLRILFTWSSGQNLDLPAATRDDFIRYQDEISHFKVSSQMRLMTVLRLLYRELEARDLLAGPNPTLTLPKIRGKAEAQPVGFSEKEVSDLLAGIKEKIDGDEFVPRYLSVRDYAIVHLALTSGLRASELVSLKVEDVRQEPDAAHWVVQVHGKGRQDRIVPIKVSTGEAINRYKQAMTEIGVTLTASDPLFIRIGPKAEPNGAEGMTTRNLGKLVTKWVSLAGLSGPRKSVHQLRRTAATIAGENGTKIDQIANMSGHADARTARDLRGPADGDLPS